MLCRSVKENQRRDPIEKLNSEVGNHIKILMCAGTRSVWMERMISTCSLYLEELSTDVQPARCGFMFMSRLANTYAPPTKTL